MLDLMFIGLETVNASYPLSGFFTLNMQETARFLIKNKNQLIVGLNFSKTELIQTNYASLLFPALFLILWLPISPKIMLAYWPQVKMDLQIDILHKGIKYPNSTVKAQRF